MLCVPLVAVLIQSVLCGNLVDVLQDDGETTLVSLVQQAGLASALSGGKLFYGLLRLIRSVLRASNCPCLKFIKIVILWVHYTILFFASPCFGTFWRTFSFFSTNFFG